VPDLSEGDELPPAGRRLHQLTKGSIAEHEVHDGPHAELQAEVLGQRLEGIDAHHREPRPQRTAGVAHGLRPGLDQARHMLVPSDF